MAWTAVQLGLFSGEHAVHHACVDLTTRASAAACWNQLQLVHRHTTVAACIWLPSLRVCNSLQRSLRFAWLQRLPECLLVVAHLVAEAEFCDDTIRTTGALNDLSMHLFPRSEYSWDDQPGET